MPSVTHPTRPLGNIAYFAGTPGDTWTNAKHRGNWQSAPGWRNSWSGTATAVFTGALNISVPEPITAMGITADDVATISLFGASITFPETSTIHVGEGSTLTLGNQILGASTFLLFGGTGNVFANASAITGRDIAVDSHLTINSASNVILDGELTGEGTLEITGGGHLIIGGIDAGSRTFENPPGFTGTIISPSINFAPVFTSPLGENGIPLWDSYGEANTMTVTASDDDGDTVTFSILTPPSHGSASIDPDTGELSYTPTSGYIGTDSFVIRANDGWGGITDKTSYRSSLPPYDLYVNEAGHQLSGTTTVSGTFNVRVSKNPAYKVLDRAFTGSGEVKVSFEGYNSLGFYGDNSAFTGQITLVNAGGVYVGDNALGIGSNVGNLGTATLSINWNGSFDFYKFPGTKTVPNNTTDNGGTGKGGFLTFGHGTYNVTGTIGHHGYTSANHGATVTLSSYPTATFHQLSASIPYPTFGDSLPGAHIILPASPNLTGKRLAVGGLGSTTTGAFSNHQLYSWSGTATGTPRIFDGFAIELTGTVSGANTIFTASDGTLIIFHPVNGIKVSRP